jgi:hypothetical protein
MYLIQSLKAHQWYYVLFSNTLVCDKSIQKYRQKISATLWMVGTVRQGHGWYRSRKRECDCGGLYRFLNVSIMFHFFLKLFGTFMVSIILFFKTFFIFVLEV